MYLTYFDVHNRMGIVFMVRECTFRAFLGCPEFETVAGKKNPEEIILQ